MIKKKQPSHQNKCWHCTFLQTTDALNVRISYRSCRYFYSTCLITFKYHIYKLSYEEGEEIVADWQVRWLQSERTLSKGGLEICNSFNHWIILGRRRDLQPCLWQQNQILWTKDVNTLSSRVSANKTGIFNEMLGQFPTGFVATEPDFFLTRNQPVTQPC